MRTHCTAQLPSRMETLLRLKQEKEELAKMRADPLQVRGAMLAFLCGGPGECACFGWGC